MRSSRIDSKETRTAGIQIDCLNMTNLGSHAHLGLSASYKIAETEVIRTLESSELSLSK